MCGDGGSGGRDLHLPESDERGERERERADAFGVGKGGGEGEDEVEGWRPFHQTRAMN